MGDSSVNLQTEIAQMISYQLCRAGFLITEFRMLVNIAPPGYHFTLDLLGALINVGIKGTCTYSRNNPHCSNNQPHAKYAKPQQLFHTHSSIEDFPGYRDPYTRPSRYR